MVYQLCWWCCIILLLARAHQTGFQLITNQIIPFSIQKFPDNMRSYKICTISIIVPSRESTREVVFVVFPNPVQAIRRHKRHCIKYPRLYLILSLQNAATCWWWNLFCRLSPPERSETWFHLDYVVRSLCSFGDLSGRSRRLCKLWPCLARKE